MSQGGYLAVAICVIVGLLITFVVSFVIYKRTPAPKGCEELKINEENCSSCGNSECEFYKKKEENKE